MHKFSLMLTGFVIALILFPALTLAQETAPSWREDLAKGKTAFGALKPAEAIKSLSAALKAVPVDPGTLPERIEMFRMRSLSYELQQDQKHAIADLRQRLLLTLEYRGKSHADLVDPMKNLARLLATVHEMTEAIAVQEKTIALTKVLGKPPVHLRLSLLHDLARFQRSAGQFENAIVTDNAYVVLLSKEKGELHADLSSPLAKLADSYRALGRYQEAISALRRRIQVFEAVKMRKNPPSIANDLAKIAALQLADQKPDEAEKTCAQWFAILNAVTKKHPELWRLHEMRAEIAKQNSDCKRESTELRSAIQYSSDLYGSTNLRVGRLLRKLSVSLRAQSKNDEALKCIQRALEVYEKRLRPQDPQIMGAVVERGHCYFALKDQKRAAASFKKALRSWEKLAGPTHGILRGPLTGLLKIAEAAKNQPQITAIKARLQAIDDAAKK